MAVGYCIDCNGRIYLGQRPWVGQSAFCSRCGADLEVTNTNPLMLEWSDYLVDEDWDEGQAPNREMVPSPEVAQHSG